MTDDLRVFWQNNDTAAALFYDLLARTRRKAYDDDFLAQLAAYREAAPASERADIFAAQYLLAHGDAENAAVCGERAYRKRPVNYEVWHVLAKAYKVLGREFDSIAMQGYSCGLYNKPDRLSLDLTKDTLQEGLNRLSVAVGVGDYAPLPTDALTSKMEPLPIAPIFSLVNICPLLCQLAASGSGWPPIPRMPFSLTRVICSLMCAIPIGLRDAAIEILYSTCKRHANAAVLLTLMYRREKKWFSLSRGQRSRRNCG